MTDNETLQTALEAFALFKSQERIRLLEVLVEVNGPVYCQELATQLHEEITEPGRSQEDVVQELHHIHLPVVVTAGIVQYDWIDRRVTSPDLDRLDTLVDAATDVLNPLRTE